MRVYIHGHIEIAQALHDAAAADPEHIRIMPTGDRTIIYPIKALDQWGRPRLLIPDAVPSHIRAALRQTDCWRISVHAVGDGEVQVRRNGCLISPGITTTTKASEARLRKYFGAAGELSVVFQRDIDGQLVHWHPVVLLNRRTGDWYIDPRIRSVGTPAELMVFIPAADGDTGDMADYELLQQEKERTRVSA